MIHFTRDIIHPGDGVTGIRPTEIMAISIADIGRITADIISLHKRSRLREEILIAAELMIEE